MRGLKLCQTSRKSKDCIFDERGNHGKETGGKKGWVGNGVKILIDAVT